VVHNVALILGQFHRQEAQEMKDEAMRTAEEHNLSVVEVAWIPGSMEAPLAARDCFNEMIFTASLFLELSSEARQTMGL
jgi:6,7-dimethyl-8-ribityllumazine synthase